MARPRRKLPVELVGGWPETRADAPAVEVARALALRLRKVMDGRSSREVGRVTGVDRTTVDAILNGTTWPDLMTVARLEAGLDSDLWPAGVARANNSTRTAQ